MTDTKLLREMIAKSGLKLGYIAQQMGLSRQALQQKINNDRDFKAGEVNELSRLLQLDNPTREAIFFSLRVD